MSDNQTDFENYDVPRTSINDATPDEWDRAWYKIQQLRQAEQETRNNGLKVIWSKPEDPCVERVVDSYLVRAAAGMNKYGMTTSANPLDLIEWLTHLQEELMDATIYIERTIEELEKNGNR